MASKSSIDSNLPFLSRNRIISFTMSCGKNGILWIFTRYELHFQLAPKSIPASLSSLYLHLLIAAGRTPANPLPGRG